SLTLYDHTTTPVFLSLHHLSRGGLRLAHRRLHCRRRFCAGGHELPVDREAEGAALADLTLDPNRPVVRLHNALHAREPHALAGDIAVRCILSSSKNEEDFAQIFRIDADPRVTHVKLSLVQAQAAPDVDRFIGLLTHVLDGVVDQVLEDLPDARL